MSTPPRPTIRSASQPLSIPRPRGYYLETPNRQRATRLYAVDIAAKVILEYAEVYWNIHFPDEPGRPIPKRDIAAIRGTIISFAAESLYDAYPGLPRHTDNIRLLTRGSQYWWLFIFKDNSSEALLNAPLDPSDVAGALEYLLVSDREPRWWDPKSPQRRDVGPA
ncbi:hypothetical protein OH77DRAFT_666297 [Trametes cingulata]|nr:hypothetical protein OH77DRAFT_666297 [Trametes cingulata]